MPRPPLLQTCLVATALILAPSAAAAHSLMRFPSAGPADIAFVARRDVWVAPRAGGRARRIVRAQGSIGYLHYSPDGRWIAFTQRIAGGQDVYAVSAEGGEIRRLTHDARPSAASNLVMGWTPDGANVVFLSDRRAVASKQMQTFLAPIGGGQARRLPLLQTGLLAFSPDGGQVAFTKTFTDLATRKRYLGGQAGELYLHDLASQSERRLTDWRGTDPSPMWVGRRVYFLSDRGAAMRLNVWVRDLDTGATRQVTHFTDFDVDWPSLSFGLMTFQQAGDLWAFDVASERLRRVKVRLPSERPEARRRSVVVAGDARAADATGATAFSTTPDGRSLLLASHGDVFRVALGGEATNLTATPATDEELPVSSPDGRQVAYVTEDANAQQLAIRSMVGGRERRLSRFVDTVLYRPVFSPDGSRLLVADAQHRLWLVSTAAGRAPVMVARDPVAEIRDAAFSPDGLLIAFSTTRPTGLGALHLYDVGEGTDRILSDELNGDRMPTFSADGRRLIFVSRRNELPLRSDRGDEVSLLTASSDGLFSVPVPERAPARDAADAMRDVLRLPVTPTRIVALEARGDAIFYQTRPPELIDGDLPGGNAQLHRLVQGRDDVVLEDFERAVPSGDGSSVAFVRSGSWRSLDLVTKAERAIPLAGLRAVVDPAAEWREMFERAWRLDRDTFFSRVMNGADWRAVHRAYSRFLPLLGSRDDALYLIGQIQGEMATSHAYVLGADPPSSQPSATSRLGADLRVDPRDGRYRFAKVFEGDPSRERFRAPLHQPREPAAAVDVVEGETLLAVDGLDLRAPTDPDALLAGRSGPIRLTIGSCDGRDVRDVIVDPVRNDLDLRQLDWVESNRAMVAALSGGRIGYLFVTDFNALGTQDLFRQLQGQLDKEGIVIDVRWNRGGYTSQAVLDVLRRVRAGSFVNREGALAPLPLFVVPRAMTVLTNADSASDGDQFPFFFRQYGLGKVVGQRTWGGVQGISGFVELMDGIRLAIPKDSLASTDGRWLIENFGTEPDVAVDPASDEASTGHDRMLEAAVAEVARALAEDPPAVARRPPPLPAYPPAGVPTRMQAHK